MKKIYLLFFLISIFFNSFAQLSDNSIQLKANGNFITVADAASASLNADMTIEMWLYYRCENTASTILMSKGWCGSSWSYYLSIDDMKLRFAKWHPALGGCAGNQAMWESNDTLLLNTWMHVAVVINGTNVNFFINGENAGSTMLQGVNNPGFHTSPQPIRIGNYVNLGGSNTSTPKSNLDDIRIWHTARTQAEIQNNMNAELIGNENGLFTYWKLNETGSGAGITVLNSATATFGTFNGTTSGTAQNILFTDNDSISNALPTCDAILWLKADTGVVLNGSNEVTQWSDLSGNNNHAVSDGTTLPTKLNNIINGKPVINFTDDRLATPLINLTSTSKAEIFTVYKGIDSDPFTIFENSDDGNVSTTGFYLADQDNSCPACQNDVSAGLKGNIGYNQNSLNQTQGCTKLINATYDKSLSSQEVKIWLNGILQAKTPGTTDDNNTNNFGNNKIYLGKRSANCVFCPGVMGQFYFAELIVFPRVLTNKEKTAVKNYIHTKYFSGSGAAFNSLPLLQTNNDNFLDDNVWNHSYHSNFTNEIIASVKSNCLDLGTRSDTVYVDATAGVYNGSRYMRRHYVINTSLNPAGAKRVRLYYTDADFTDLQTYVPSLTSHSQLCITKYDGANEDGIYDPAGGSVTLIPSNQITTGTAFGQHYLEFEVNDFSEFWIHSFNIPLPVNLISFTANKCNNNSACIEWHSAQESNFSNYELQKSIDGINFQTIDIQQAKLQTENKYGYEDMNLNSTVYYRLQMNDIDHKHSFSNVVSLNFTKNNEIQISPNPASNTITINGMKDAIKIEIINVQGQVVKRINTNLQNETIDISNFANGFYTVQITQQNEVITNKLIIKK